MKSNVTITIDSEVLQEIKGGRVNVSELCNSALKSYLGLNIPQEKKLLMEKLRDKEIEVAILKEKTKEAEVKEREVLEEIEQKRKQCALCKRSLGKSKMLFSGKWICGSCFDNLKPKQIDMLRDG